MHKLIVPCRPSQRIFSIALLGRRECLLRSIMQRTLSRSSVNPWRENKQCLHNEFGLQNKSEAGILPAEFSSSSRFIVNRDLVAHFQSFHSDYLRCLVGGKGKYIFSQNWLKSLNLQGCDSVKLKPLAKFPILRWESYQELNPTHSIYEQTLSEIFSIKKFKAFLSTPTNKPRNYSSIAGMSLWFNLTSNYVKL